MSKAPRVVVVLRHHPCPGHNLCYWEAVDLIKASEEWEDEDKVYRARMTYRDVWNKEEEAVLPTFHIFPKERIGDAVYLAGIYNRADQTQELKTEIFNLRSLISKK